MKTKLFCNLFRNPLVGQARTVFFCAPMLAAFFSPPLTAAGEAPSWMHALTSVAVPAHDEKTDAVELYSEDVLNVAPNGKIKNIRRRAYKVLRPGGKEYGL